MGLDTESVAKKEKSAEFLLPVLKNAESNAEHQGFAVDSLAVEHITRTKHLRYAEELTELMAD